MLGVGELYLTQKDGGSPTTSAIGRAPGQSGISVLSVRFRGELHLSATLRHHLVCFVTQVRIDCRMADRALRHDAPAGSLGICPAGIDCAADAKGDVDAILVTIDPAQFALAAAEQSALEAQLVERLSGYDPTLFDRARILASESAHGYPNGPLLWNEVAWGFINRLIARNALPRENRVRGALGKDVLKRLKDYALANLDGPIEVATLADIAGRSAFHFSRVFARSVGLTPHRYVVHLRLRRAIELVRAGQPNFAEIAARTGFADQSHLSRWMRRVHGVSLTQLVA